MSFSTKLGRQSMLNWDGEGMTRSPEGNFSTAIHRQHVLALPANNAIDVITDFALTSVTPSSATFKGLTPLIIIGTGFNDITYTITIDGNLCTDIVRVSNTELNCTSPASLTSGEVVLRVTGGGDNETIAFTYLKAIRITILEEFQTALATILISSGFNFDMPADKIIREPDEIKKFSRLSLPVLFLKSGEQEGIVPISNGGYRNTFVIQVHGIISADADLSRDGNQSDEYEKLKEDIRESVMSHFKTGSFSDFVIQITPATVEKSEIFEEAMRMNFEIIYDNTFTVI